MLGASSRLGRGAEGCAADAEAMRLLVERDSGMRPNLSRRGGPAARFSILTNAAENFWEACRVVGLLPGSAGGLCFCDSRSQIGKLRRRSCRSAGVKWVSCDANAFRREALRCFGGDMGVL